MTVLHSLDFAPCFVTAICITCFACQIYSQLNSEARVRSKGLTALYKDQPVMIQFTATHIFKGATATPRLCFTLALLLWCYTSAYSVLCKPCLSFSWYAFYYKISLNQQVCVSWFYAFNISVNEYTHLAVTSYFHNCYDKLKSVQSCSFAEAQTPLYRSWWDQVLWMLPAGEARRIKIKHPVRYGRA